MDVFRGHGKIEYVHELLRVIWRSGRCSVFEQRDTAGESVHEQLGITGGNGCP